MNNHEQELSYATKANIETQGEIPSLLSSLEKESIALREAIEELACAIVVILSQEKEEKGAAPDPSSPPSCEMSGRVKSILCTISANKERVHSITKRVQV